MTPAELRQQYRSKLGHPGQAARLIPAGARVTTQIGCGQPPAILAGLAERARTRAEDLRTIRFYYLLCTGIAGQSVFAPALAETFIAMS